MDVVTVLVCVDTVWTGAGVTVLVGVTVTFSVKVIGDVTAETVVLTPATDFEVNLVVQSLWVL